MDGIHHDRKIRRYCQRKVKGATVWPSQNFGSYKAQEPCDILQRGGISVICAWGTPHVGADVYVRTKVADGTSPAGAALGDLGAADETGNCVKLTGVKWSSTIWLCPMKCP